jgi:hypothetical protein
MRRWGDNDKHFGPLTFAFRETWRPFSIVLSSGSTERESPGCCIRFQALGGTMICELPAVVKPWRRWIDLRGKEWAKGDGYWDEHPREYGFTLSDGHLSVKLGAQTMDSSTTQDWGCFLPWTQWRHVRHSLYGLEGEHFWTEPRAGASGKLGGDGWKAYQTARDACPVAKFAFKDFDDQELVAATRIEEREWRFGTGWFKWLSLFRRAKISRSLNLDFSGETGPEKGSWKGGTVGHSIEMLPGELHEAAFRRYCDEEHRSKYRKYRITFLARVSLTQDEGGK